MAELGTEPNKVYVTNVIDPLFFYAVIGPENYRQTFLEYEAKWGEQAKSLGQVSVENLHTGQWVMAFSSDWKKLIRAKITRIIQNTDVKLDVYCLDYGTSEILPIKDVYPGLDTNWTSVPGQAVSCKIAGVKPIVKNWTSRAKGFFKECVLHQELDMQVHSYDLDGSYSLEVIIEDEGEFKSLSELLVEEGMAAPEKILPAKDGSQIPAFNLALLQKQLSTTVSSPSEEPDIEYEEWKKAIGPAPSHFTYGKSDDTLGEHFQPNVGTDMLHSIQDELNNLRQHRYESPTKGRGRASVKKNLESPTCGVRGRQLARENSTPPPVPGYKARKGDSLSIPVRDTKLTTDSGQCLRKPRSPVGRGRRRSTKRDRERPSGLQLSDDKLNKEYEWYSSRLEDKLRKILKEVYDDINFVKAKLRSLIYPDDDSFAGTLSELLWTLEAEYVKPDTTGGFQGHAEAFGLVAGQLFTEVRFWSEVASDAVRVCVYGFLDKWSGVNQNPVYLEAYGTALESLLKIAGEEFKETVPLNLDAVYKNTADIISSDTIPRDAKYQHLRILLASKGTNGIVTETSEWKEDIGNIYSDKCIQAKPEQVDVDVQVNIFAYSRALSTDLSSLMISPRSEDPYVLVKEMLKQLQLTDVLPVFTSNAIRDVTLGIEWAELKKLLKECGLKPGQIYEIKNYLGRKDDGNRSSSDSSHTSNSYTGLENTTGYHQHTDEEKPLLLTPDSFTGQATQLFSKNNVQDDVNCNMTTVRENLGLIKTNHAFRASPSIRQGFQESESLTRNVGNTDNIRTVSPLQCQNSANVVDETSNMCSSESDTVATRDKESNLCVATEFDVTNPHKNFNEENPKTTKEGKRSDDKFESSKKSLNNNEYKDTISKLSSTFDEQVDDQEFPILNQEKRKRKKLVKQAVERSVQSKQKSQTSSFGKGQRKHNARSRSKDKSADYSYK